MLSFLDSLPEFITNLSEEAGSMSSNTKGVLHELLVGYHLNGGHMEKHPNVAGESPKEAHDRLKKSVSKEDYALANKRAKAAADDIKKAVGRHGAIHSVHWTSKPGDIERSTGIAATQKEDPSDLVITTKKGKELKHHGVSLKVSDSPGDVPVSNPGMESTYGGGEILEKHRALITKKHKLAGMNKDARKAYLKKNPAANEDVRQRNSKVLTDIVGHMHKKLSFMPTAQLAQHIRNHVLHAHPTPMQRMGHEHIKHTTTGTSNFQFSHADPAKDYEHILKDHKNIKVVPRGTSVIFTHKGEPFARHRMKFESQSDPLSSVKGSGELV